MTTHNAWRRFGLPVVVAAVVLGIGWYAWQAGFAGAPAQGAPGWGPAMMGWGWGPGMMGNQGAGMMDAHHAAMHGGAATIPQRVPAPADPAAPRLPVTATLSEWRLLPARLEGAAGQVLVLTIKNDGVIPHRLAVPALGLSAGPIAPGATETIELPLVKAGQFAIFCDVPGHREAGQQATLVVRPR